MSTQTLTPQNDNAVAALSDMLGKFAAGNNVDQRDSLMFAAALIQTVQRLNTGTPAEDLQATLAQTIASLSKLSWSSVPFPIAATLLSQTYADICTENNVRDSDRYKILLESLVTFVCMLQSNPEYATESVLRSIVSDAASSLPKPATAPELNYRANVLKIFTPGHVAAVDLEPLSVVIYRGELLGGGFGPELWGLAYTKDEQAHVLLETGEYVSVPAVSLVLASTKDYDTSELPPYLMACAKLFVPIMLSGLASGQQAEMQETIDRLSKHFGVFTLSPALEVVTLNDVIACENVLDSARWAGTDPQKNGAITMIDIPATQLRVILTAQQAAIRPFITTTLVRTDNNAILMRLDVPREFSARGIYLFPRGEQSAALIVV